MQLTNIVAIVAVLATSVAAGRAPPRPERPSRPEGPVFQSISCSSGGPFCCAPESTLGTTCTAMTGSSVSCNTQIVCCNNNGGTQTCSATLQQPVTFVGL
ncbi:hydrophobin 1 [Histoplasma capsulatum G186AR]|uniref:Hydrophobin 1 n=1 Tax=Ajellomyces capsulatus (strain G186AR / H82 / ATCC MYA-2454 / RMSCC 2432) TaxID=447093 RepID=C0NST0_AJECG|nr:hydrophobin 1 [Histoplasma capsulatum G186AR]EEH05946.1 hydrophobin 1 [Histoplasma capsulatum G186AR]